MRAFGGMDFTVTVMVPGTGASLLGAGCAALEGGALALAAGVGALALVAAAVASAAGSGAGVGAAGASAAGMAALGVAMGASTATGAAGCDRCNTTYPSTPAARPATASQAMARPEPLASLTTAVGCVDGVWSCIALEARTLGAAGRTDAAGCVATGGVDAGAGGGSGGGTEERTRSGSVCTSGTGVCIAARYSASVGGSGAAMPIKVRERIGFCRTLGWLGAGLSGVALAEASAAGGAADG